MFSYIWHTFFFDPVYNGLVFFIDIIPGGDLGIAIIGITILVKLILLPLSIKATKTQVVMREIEPKLKELRERVTDRQEQARAMMDIYKEAGINPFASIFLIFLQIPILVALYLSVYSGGDTFSVNPEFLYSFVPNPENIDLLFLGWQDITERSVILAAIAGIAQYIHTSLAMPNIAPKAETKDGKPDFKAEFTRNMQLQMKYVMPVLIFFFAYTISAAIALYFAVSNIFAIVQEYVVKRYR